MTADQPAILTILKNVRRLTKRNNQDGLLAVANIMKLNFR
jgi:hypothetical protein